MSQITPKAKADPLLQHTIAYRSEIDGLRAIAVCAVLIYHAEFMLAGGKQVLSGGFLGVDIFFVISGFLITSIILRELGKTGRFRFADFYERRARRILPALFIVMLATLPFAWMLMTPAALREHAGAGLSSLFFGSNIWFWQENSYTAEASQLKPLLHTWTLSVEEQFYVVFPILLLFAWAYFRRWLLVLLVALSALSLQLSQMGSTKFHDANFYLLPSRGWELLAGSMLAFVRPDWSRPVDGFSKIAPALGLALILGPMWFYTDTMRHPGFITVVPIVGTALIIQYANPKDWVTKALSLRPFVAIGLVSYSLYLWHLPVFAFSKLSGLGLGVTLKILLLAVSGVLAMATYYLIERPFRSRTTLALKPFAIILGTGFLILAASFTALFTGRALPAKYAVAEDFVDFRYAYQPIYREGTCFLPPAAMEPFSAEAGGDASTAFSKCPIMTISEDKPTLYLWGDSHAAHLFAGYQDQYGDKFNIVQRTASACAPINGRLVASRPGCKEINESVFQEIARTPPQRVVLAAYWWAGSTQVMDATIDALISAGVENVEIVGPVPRWTTSLPVLLSTQIAEKGFVVDYIDTDLMLNTFEIDAEWRRFARDNGLTYHSPANILCRENLCLTRVAPGPTGITQWDTAHLTEAGSIYVVSQFDR